MAKAIKSVLRRNLAGALSRGDLRQAKLLLERLQEEDALSVETRGMELEYLIRSRRLQEAQVLGDQLRQWFPASPRIQFLAGQVAYQSRDYRAAAERYRESFRIRPHWRSSLALAKTLTQLGEFDEAARILESLLPDHPECHRDLAWLHERRGDIQRALDAIGAYLNARPDDQWAKTQQVRLRARVMAPEELVSEAREMMEFGEELTESVMPEYMEALFRTGRPDEVRQYIAQHRSSMSPQVVARAGWTCYRYQAYDLAWELFLASFDGSCANVKFLTAIEFAAIRCGRVAELIRLYESRALQNRRLYGRLHGLRRRASPG
jgi:tetratricopeptide (TPR) repeat protein